MRSKRPRSIYFEVTDHVIRGAIVVAEADGTKRLEQVKECSVGAPALVKDFVQSFGTGRSAGVVRSRCGVYPESRFLRLLTLEEPVRLSEQRVLNNLASKEFRVRADEYALVPLSPDEGTVLEPTRAAKRIFVCGARQTEIRKIQEQLIQNGIYPERLEVASTSTAGLLLQLMKEEESPPPLLVLEIGMEASNVFILANNRIDAARPVAFGLNSMISVLKEQLGLKDDAAARKLFYSESFDLTEMGPRMIDRLLRELQSSVGYYEVQTGQSVGRLFCSLLPQRLAWVNTTFAQALGTDALEPDMPRVLETFGVQLGSQVSDVPVAWLGLIGLMSNFEKTTGR